MDLNKGVPTLFAYCEKLIWKFFFKFNEGMCPRLVFAWIFFRIFLIFFFRGVCGANHLYIVFRGSNISCSLACIEADCSAVTPRSPSRVRYIAVRTLAVVAIDMSSLTFHSWLFFSRGLGQHRMLERGQLSAWSSVSLDLNFDVTASPPPPIPILFPQDQFFPSLYSVY